jgi:hypothetical protein
MLEHKRNAEEKPVPNGRRVSHLLSGGLDRMDGGMCMVVIATAARVPAPKPPFAN